jgi:hypothetical protein
LTYQSFGRGFESYYNLSPFRLDVHQRQVTSIFQYCRNIDLVGTSLDGLTSRYSRNALETGRRTCSWESIMRCLFQQLLRSLLISMVGLLVVVGTAQAHGGRIADSDWPRSLDSVESPADTRPPLSRACVPPVTVSAFVTPPMSRWISSAEVDPFDDVDDGHLIGSYCCGAACHVAVTNIGLTSMPGWRPRSVDPVTDSSILHGRPVGPGDRPPRSA